MTNQVAVKICGITTPDALAAAASARFVGFVFYPRSPRSLAPALAGELARQVGTGTRVVGLFVDPTNDWLDHILSQVPLDMIQLHGHETPGRVQEIAQRFGLPIIKAIGIASRDDLRQIADYEPFADWLLFDAKPPANVTALPGGNGLVFDWTILHGLTTTRPWMLSGGLTVDNVQEAIRLTGAHAVDVSSGVEDRPGLKNPARIHDFLTASQGAA